MDEVMVLVRQLLEVYTDTPEMGGPSVIPYAEIRAMWGELRELVIGEGS